MPPSKPAPTAATPGAENRVWDEVSRLESEVVANRTEMAEVRTDLRNLRTDVVNIGNSVQELARAFRESSKTPWSALGTWATVVVVALAMIGTLRIEPIEDLLRHHVEDGHPYTVEAEVKALKAEVSLYNKWAADEDDETDARFSLVEDRLRAVEGSRFTSEDGQQLHAAVDLLRERMASAEALLDLKREP